MSTKQDLNNTTKSVTMNSEHTPCPKKTCDYIFYNNFNNRCPRHGEIGQFFVFCDFPR